MDGDNLFSELNNATLLLELLNFQFLGIRTISNTTDLTYRVARWVSVHGGHHFASRRIRSVQAAEVLGISVAVRAEQENQLHSGLFGLRLQPIKPLTLNLDGEIGRADRPFFPIGERNYHQFGGRVQYKSRSLLFHGAARLNYNTNSVSLATHSARGRQYALGGSWAPRDWLAFDANYSKLHLDTVSGIAYFASGSLVTGDRSIYLSNIHAVNLNLRFGLLKRADLFLGYSRVQDLGDGRPAADVSTEGGSARSVFLSAQTFPLAFESPLARFSVRLHRRLRWNVGYQFYHYTEQFQSQRYRAHTGYTSLLCSF